MDVTYVTCSTSLPAKTSPTITIGLLASILWLQMKYLKKNSLYQQKQNSFGYSAQEKGHISIYWLREMSWIGYSLSEQSFLFIESFKSIPGQLQAFGIENNLNSINLHLLVLIKGISTKLRYFQISSVALNFRLIEKEKKGKKNHFWI